MPKKYTDIYDQLLKNSKQVGECIESTYKSKKKNKAIYMTYKNKMIACHRASYEYHKGQIPDGLYVCHHCDNPKCFRIEHLFLGTASDNMQDMVKKRRDNLFGNRKYPLEMLERATKLRALGYTYKMIGISLDMNPNAVSALLIRHKVKVGTCV